MKSFIIIAFEILLFLFMLALLIPVMLTDDIVFPALLTYISLETAIRFWRKPIMTWVLSICMPIIILHFLGYKLYSQPIYEESLIYLPDGHSIVKKNAPILKNNFTIKEFIAPNIIIDSNNTQHMIKYIEFTKEDIKKHHSWQYLDFTQKHLSVYILPNKHYYIAYKIFNDHPSSPSFSFFSPKKIIPYHLMDIDSLPRGNAYFNTNY